MYFARVLGEVVCTKKADGLLGTKLMLVEPLDERGKAMGAWRVAADTVRAGVTDIVACVGSREAAHALLPAVVPVDDAIVGIVDDFSQSAVACGDECQA